MTAAGPQGAFEPISLGYLCEVKYQLSRDLYRRRFPDGDLEECRRQLLTPDYGQRTFRRHVFDWQITPFDAVVAYLENDFRGVFEREDLVVDGGEVIHRTLGTRHPHEFHAVDGGLDDAAIDLQYPAARGKFDHLAERFRAHLRSPGRYLYVFRQVRIYDDTVRLMRLLGAHNPEHRFNILYVGEPGEDQNLMALEGDVFKAWAPLAVRWEGDDDAWDRILRPLDLIPAAEARFARSFEESLERSPPRRGLLARLLGR